MSNIDVLSVGIKQIYQTRGNEAFINARLFHALLDDLVPSAGNERKIIRKTIDDALLKDLFSMATDNSSGKQLEAMKIIKKIEDSCGLSSKWSSYIVQSFLKAFECPVNIHEATNSSNAKIDTDAGCSENHGVDSSIIKKCILKDGSIWQRHIRKFFIKGTV